jgi:U3 small nucleolar RNA-associated protein 10
VTKVCVVKKFQNSSNNFETKFIGVRKSIATSVPFRTLTGSFEKAYQELSESPDALCNFFNLATEACSKAEKADLEAVLPQLQKFMLKALDYRNANPSVDVSSVEKIEKTCISCLVSFVPKLSEATFRPLFYKLYDWSIRSKGGKLYLRVITFYGLCEHLADTLKSLFCAFAAPFIVSDCVLQLNRYNLNLSPGQGLDRVGGGGGQGEEEGQEGYPRIGESFAHCILLHVLATLSRCFVHDVNGAFASKERVNTLMQPIIDQISNELGSKEEYEARMTQGVGKCIQHLARALEDNAMTRDLHYRLLLKTRENSEQARLNALRVLHQMVLTLSEDYLPLLPEAVTFLHELHEDDSEEIQKLLKVVLMDMENVLGEPIASYF